MRQALLRSYIDLFVPSINVVIFLGISLTSQYVLAQTSSEEVDDEQSGSREVSDEVEDEEGGAEGTHCYGEDRNVWVFREMLGLMSNSSGIENRMHAGACTPLIMRPGMLFDMTNMEAGVFNLLSPSYIHQGFYASIVPLSFLVLEVKMSGAYVWTTGLSGTGHNSRVSYAHSFPSNGFSHEIEGDPTTTTGFRAAWYATFRASYAIAHIRHGDIEIIGLDSLGGEYWLMGNDPYYYNLRTETIMARSDFVLSNDFALLVSIPITENISMMTGVLDSLIYLPRANRVDHNMVAGIVSVTLAQLGQRVRGLRAFIIAGGYTNHESRELTFGANFGGGVELSVVLN